MKFADGDVLRGDVGFGEGGPRGFLRHAVSHQVDGGAVEEGGAVSGEVLTCYEDGLRAEVGAGVEKGFGDDDGGGAAVGGGTALEFGEGGVDLLGGEDLVEGVGVAELGVGVFGRVEVVDACYFGKVFCCCTVPKEFTISAVELLRTPKRI